MKRFSFFVSRRREDNRERFRLHMGYFSSLAEAEEWLNVIRDIYPGAWAGEAPGKKLRARAAAAELANQLPSPPTAAVPRVVSVSAKTAPTAPAQVAAPVVARQALPSATDLIVPTLHAAPGAFAPTNASATGMHRALPDPAGTGTHRALTNPSATGAHRAPPNASATGMHRALPDTSATGMHRAPVNVASATGMHRALENQSATGTHRALPNASATGTHRALVNPSATGTHKAFTPPTAPVQTRPVSASVTPAPAGPSRGAQQAKQPAAAQPPRQPAKAVPKKQQPGVPHALSGSNVREVMAALDETGETRQMRAPAFNPSSTASAPSVARASALPAGAAPVAPARAKAPVSRPQAPTAEAPDLSDTQVLRMLETASDDDAERADDANAGISLLKPDDTQTRRALKEAVLDNAPVSFAVQLQWSVQPVRARQGSAARHLQRVHAVHGGRQPRRPQVVRAAPRLFLRRHLCEAGGVLRALRVHERRRRAGEPGGEGARERRRDQGRHRRVPAQARGAEESKSSSCSTTTRLPAAEPQPRAESGRGAEGLRRRPPRARRRARTSRWAACKAKEQRPPKTLEETLEILGASELEIDNGRGEVLNDTGVRHLRVEVQKNTPFAKLLDQYFGASSPELIADVRQGLNRRAAVKTYGQHPLLQPPGD